MDKGVNSKEHGQSLTLALERGWTSDQLIQKDMRAPSTC